MPVVRLLLALVLLGSGAGAQVREGDLAMPMGALIQIGEYATVDPGELRRHPERYDGQRVKLTAEVVSVSVKYSVVHVFDGRSRALISVALDDLNHATRQSLVHDHVRRLAVFGRVGLDRGLWVVRAEKVEAVRSEIAYNRFASSSY
ncbi:MAG: hypothetical protein KF868_07775 [Acidobacteria bacterium]|nr:hypothetical protein [Acidobacteriota bacterium]MCW5967892.1 hypothetical protein [Blastocatellales bacterium]